MSIYEQLGVRRIVNAFGNLTPFGGSLMDPEVLRVMAEAGGWFVDIRDLLRKAGRRIADLAGVEDAFITSGAAAGLVLSTAACVAGRDPLKIARLPDTTGMKDEVIIHKCQRNVWDQAIQQVGIKLVEIGTPTGTTAHDLEAAFSEKTAAVVYFVAHDEEHSIPLGEMIRIAGAQQTPLIVDAAAELPPVENIHRFNDMGADLVIFSGGKMLRGPQCSGLILGRHDLIEACALHASPNFAIGRPMKVGKEEIAGLVRAVELFLAHDFDVDMQRWERQVACCLEAFKGLMGVRSRRVFPGEDAVLPRWVPRVYMNWDVTVLRVTPQQITQRLLEREPSVAVGPLPEGLSINPIMLNDGEEEIVARCVVEAFTA